MVVITSIENKSYYIHKYPYPFSQITEYALEQFINEFYENKLEEFFISEPIPSNPLDGLFRKVVSINFDDEVLNHDQHVLGLFWSSEYPNLLKKPKDEFKEVWRNLS